MLEKETKTKAYSKEGLSAALRKDKDTTEDPNHDIICWIDESIETLKDQQSSHQQEAASTPSKKKARAEKQLCSRVMDFVRAATIITASTNAVRIHKNNIIGGQEKR